MIPGVEIVDQQDVDPIDPEPLQAVLERAHHAVVAVVEHGLEFEAAEPLILDGVGPERPAQDAADLGRYDVVAARLAIERPAERMLGKSAPVPRRGVEIAHAAVPRGRDERPGLVVVDAVEELAERRGSEAELGDADVRPAELARLQGREIAPLMPLASSNCAKREPALLFGLGSEAQRIALGRAGFGAAGSLGLGDVLREAQRRRRRLCDARSSSR